MGGSQKRPTPQLLGPAGQGSCSMTALPRAAAREYLAGLLEYLESFYERTQPLSSLGKARTATTG